jgi:hypothetical protein
MSFIAELSRRHPHADGPRHSFWSPDAGGLQGPPPAGARDHGYHVRVLNLGPGETMKVRSSAMRAAILIVGDQPCRKCMLGFTPRETVPGRVAGRDIPDD